MSLHLHDETKVSLGQMLYRHIKNVAIAKGISKTALKFLCAELSGELASLSDCIFECVRLPATGTKSFLVAVRISSAFDAYVAQAAENWLLRHGACSLEQRRLTTESESARNELANDPMLATALKPDASYADGGTHSRRLTFKLNS